MARAQAHERACPEIAAHPQAQQQAARRVEHGVGGLLRAREVVVAAAGFDREIDRHRRRGQRRQGYEESGGLRGASH
jgi:hypothetical protein